LRPLGEHLTGTTQDLAPDGEHPVEMLDRDAMIGT
jgi:hypothetical protein